MMRPSTVPFIAAIVAVVLMVSCIVWIDSDNPKYECVRLGYPDVRFSGGVTYCLKRIDGTDVLVPLEQARTK